MIQSIAVPVAEALHQALSVFHAVSQESLRAVRVENDLERVIFDFDKGALVVEGNPDDDSIEIRLVSQGEFAGIQAVAASHRILGRLSSGNRSGGDGSLLTSRDTVMACCSVLAELTATAIDRRGIRISCEHHNEMQLTKSK